MKPEQLYQNLKDLAEKLNITVHEQNFRTTGLNVKSGLCKVKGKNRFIMDKHLSVHRKARVLAACLRNMPHENIYVVPAVREILTSGKKTAPESDGASQKTADAADPSEPEKVILESRQKPDDAAVPSEPEQTEPESLQKPDDAAVPGESEKTAPESPQKPDDAAVPGESEKTAPESPQKPDDTTVPGEPALESPQKPDDAAVPGESEKTVSEDAAASVESVKEEA